MSVFTYNALQAPRVNSRPVSMEAHTEPQFEEGEVENEPEVRADVVRESDKNHSEELPEAGQSLNFHLESLDEIFQ